MIYFDNAATSFLKPPEVAEAVYQSFSQIGNAGRGAHAPTLNASRLLYNTRIKLAELFHIEDSSRIAFASNVTEALNAVISGLIQEKDHAITTVCEHNSVLRPLYRKEKSGTRLTILPADEKGRISYEELERAIEWDTKAIIVGHASNLSGNIVDLKRISQMAHKKGVLLLVDAAQTAGAIPIDVQEMGIDILCFTGHKGLLGPQGTGGVYVRPGISVPPLKTGGSGIHSFAQEHPSVMPASLEAGTQNGHGIAGLYAALTFLEKTGVSEIQKKEEALARRFLNGIKNLEGVHLYGDYEAALRAPIVTLNLGDLDSAEVCDILWEDYEICVRGGAHCAPLMHACFGTREQGAVRFSFSYFNTEEEIDFAVKALGEML